MKGPSICAHRGASAYAPENTLEAFALAEKMRADGIELDVHLTSDGQVVVIHDEKTGRVSEENLTVGESTLAELKRVDVSRLHPENGACRIPTLAEVLELLKPGNMYINIELKTLPNPYPGIEEKVLKLIADANMDERVLFSSFNHDSLVRMKELAPGNLCGLLYSCLMHRPWDYAKSIGVDALHPHYIEVLLQKKEPEKCHALGLKVHPWTVDREKDIRELTRLGCDMLITNVPDAARRISEDELG